MTVETKTGLNEETLEKLQSLIRANMDACEGFREAAEDVKDQAVANVFRELAIERSENVEVLQSFVEWNGEEAEDDGSYAGVVHRAWLTVRGFLNGGDPHVILIEAERGEDHIKRAYEDVLRETAGSAMNDILQQQYAGVKAGHDRVRDLRDAFAGKS